MTPEQKAGIKAAAKELEAALNEVGEAVNVEVSRYAAGVMSDGTYRYIFIVDVERVVQVAKYETEVIA